MLPGEVTNETHYGHHRIPKGGWKRETRDIHQGIILIYHYLLFHDFSLSHPSNPLPPTLFLMIVNRDMMKEMGMNDPYSMTNFDSNACSYMKCKSNITSNAATSSTTPTTTTSTATTTTATSAATTTSATTPATHHHNSSVPKHHREGGHKHHNGTRGHGHHHNGSALHSLVNSLVGLANGHGGGEDNVPQKPPTI